MKIHKLQLASIANRGKNVVDYFLCSRTTFDLISKMYVDDNESDHFSIITLLKDLLRQCNDLTIIPLESRR